MFLFQLVYLVYFIINCYRKGIQPELLLIDTSAFSTVAVIDDDGYLPEALHGFDMPAESLNKD